MRLKPVFLILRFQKVLIKCVNMGNNIIHPFHKVRCIIIFLKSNGVKFDQHFKKS
jgi:hypothetical protein